jgi:urea transport system ATP-binding protein
MMQSPLLSVENVTVSFDGFKALNGMSLQLMPTSIRVLVGPNGAGKSTLLDTIIGHVRPTEGKVIFKGEEITRMNEFKIVRKGICRKFQAPGILENLTVVDNLNLAAQQNRECHRSMGIGLSREERERVEYVLEKIGLKDRRKALAGQLAHGQKQWLEIGMVVASDADLLLLDEPAAGMSPDESSQTAELIRGLSKKHSILVIDHDMTFVAQLEAPVTVMHMGRLLKEGTLEEIQRDPVVISVYLGREKEIPHA